MINWTNEALDAAAAAVNGRGYSRFAVKNKTKIREEMRDILNAAVAAQGCIELPDDLSGELQDYIQKTIHR